MAIIAFCSEFSKIAVNMVNVNGIDGTQGMTIDPHVLPLHLCSLMIFIFFYFPFCQNEKTKNRLINFLYQLVY